MRGRRWGEPHNFAPLLGLLYWLGGDLTYITVRCYVAPKAPPSEKLERERLHAIQDIKRFVTCTGRAPTVRELGYRDIRQKHPALPSYNTLTRLFGSLRKVYLICNLNPPQAYKRKKQRKSSLRPSQFRR